MAAYLHGYSSEEQERLLEQGQILSPFIFDKLDLKGVSHILEVGSGVGAMTQNLLMRYPKMQITGLEIAETQVEKAKTNLSEAVQHRQVRFQQADAREMPFENNTTFDGAFLCWVLEHIPQPEKVLSEVHRVLKKNSPIFITEVMHSSLRLSPNCPNIMEFWQKTIDFQSTLDGDANIGYRLGNLLNNAGFHHIQVFPYSIFFDKRSPSQRTAILNYWHGLMASGVENLLNEGYCDEELWVNAEQELFDLMNDEEAVFYYTFMQGIANV